MISARPQRSLVLTYEIFLREFDAKLLLAAVAARRGWDVYFGPVSEMMSRRRYLPRSLFWITDAALARRKVLDQITNAGHELIAGDEEGVVHFNAATFARERLDEEALSRMRLAFFWGDRYHRVAKERYPEFAERLRPTGNPRIDLLRPEFAAHRREVAHRLRERHGNFILIVSNFGGVNIFHGDFERFFATLVALTNADQELQRFYRASFNHQREIFQYFLAALPNIAKAFPERKVIVRPHPAERFDAWIDASRSLANVEVIREGNIIDWLEGCDVMIHNSCTTAVEGLVIGAPCIAYRPIAADEIEPDLPNQVSLALTSLDAVCAEGRRIVDSGLRAHQLPGYAERFARLSDYITALEGPLACQRIVDEMERLALPQGSYHATTPLSLYRLKRLAVDTLQTARHLMGHQTNVSGYVKSISLDEAQRILTEFQRSYPLIEGVCLSSLGNGCFQLSMPPLETREVAT